MHPPALWAVSFVLGVGDALLTGLLGVIVGAVFFVLALPLAVRGDREAALSGLFAGFGAAWFALLGRQASTGGRLDDPAPWVALGVVPLAVGLGLGLRRLARRGARTDG